MLNHCRLLAGYNLKMNRQVYQAASALDEAALNSDEGAYFGSVLGTLNHILVGDLIWLGRFAAHSERYTSLAALAELPRPEQLRQILYPQFAALASARKLVDEAIVLWTAEELVAADLDQPLAYKNVKSEASIRDFGALVMHFFNHQTHHRGQVSTLLSQRGIDIGCTDFLVHIPLLDSL
ncbi:MAG TPA: DinB family protein [Cellvibrionaceae bacterium]